MGLDIRAYSNIKIESDIEYDSDGDLIDPKEKCVRFNDNTPCFNSVGLDLNYNKWYSFEEYFYFRVGSYGYYNHFRDTLAKLVGYSKTDNKHSSYAAFVWNDEYKGLPFEEMINFTDCDGTIGTEFSKKLYNDFISFEELLLQNLNTETSINKNFFIETYNNFKEAFKIASDNGAIKFS